MLEYTRINGVTISERHRALAHKHMALALMGMLVLDGWWGMLQVVAHATMVCFLRN
jgi:hypothetical protein